MLFAIDVRDPVAPYPNDYAVSADGQRFIVASHARLPVPQTLSVIHNWTAALQRPQQ